MLGSLIDDLKFKVDGMLRLAVAGSIAAVAGIVAFFCFAVALFLWIQQTYGTLEAWLAIGGLFAAIALIGGISVLVLRRRTRVRDVPKQAKPQESSPIARMMQDPAILLTGIQIARMLGRRGIITVLLLGAAAGGLLISRDGRHEDYDPDEFRSAEPAE